MNVMYFSADWCGPCKVFKPIVQQVSQELGISVNYINVDYDASFTQKYSITSVPTIMITNDQEEVVYRKSGVMSRDQVISMFNQFR
jgi:thioredoxin 1